MRLLIAGMQAADARDPGGNLLVRERRPASGAVCAGGHSGGSHSGGSHSGGSHSGGRHSGGSHSGGHSGHVKGSRHPGSTTHGTTHHWTGYVGARDGHGRLVRSEAAKREFMRETGYPHGRPGYVVDHIIALKRGGPDRPSNMQWQTITEAKAKDKWE